MLGNHLAHHYSTLNLRLHPHGAFDNRLVALNQTLHSVVRPATTHAAVASFIARASVCGGTDGVLHARAAQSCYLCSHRRPLLLISWAGLLWPLAVSASDLPLDVFVCCGPSVSVNKMFLTTITCLILMSILKQQGVFTDTALMGNLLLHTFCKLLLLTWSILSITFNKHSSPSFHAKSAVIVVIQFYYRVSACGVSCDRACVCVDPPKTAHFAGKIRNPYRT